MIPKASSVPNKIIVVIIYTNASTYKLKELNIEIEQNRDRLLNYYR